VGLRSHFPSTSGELTICGSGQMQSSKSRTGSSRTRGLHIEAEGVTGHENLCSTPSTSMYRPEEARQGEEGPLASMEVPILQQDAKHMPASVRDETHSTVLSPDGPATSFASPLALSATEGHLGHPDHYDLRSGRPTALDFATSPVSAEQITPIDGTASKSSVRG
jgi:hypothetical protein